MGHHDVRRGLRDLSSLLSLRGACALAALLTAPLLLLGTAAPAAAQEGTIAGTVVDAESGRAVEGANVALEGLELGSITDVRGAFRITGVPAGAHTLRVTHLGHEARERRVTVEAGGELSVTVRLQPSAIGLGGITVTSRMREEAAGEAPVTQTVFNTEQIEDAGIDEPQELLDLTPNAALVQAQNVGTAFITVRGISQNRNTQTPVAVLVDDVLQISPNQFNQALFDVDRVEVLKGPQGALYGRNAIAGAIIVETNEPTNEWEGNISVGAGNGETREVRVAFGGPIVEDELLFRVAGRFIDQEGFLDMETLDRKADYFTNSSFRGKLRWLPDPAFQADLKVLVDRVEGGSLNFQYQPALFAEDGVTLDPDNPFPFDFGRIDANDVDRDMNHNNLGYDERHSDLVSLRLQYDTEFATLRSISSYNNLMEFFDGDQFPYTASLSRSITGFGTIDGTQTQFLDVEGWSQEVRLISPEEQRVRWMIGGYYLAWDRFISSTTGLDIGKGIERLEREPAFNSTTNPTLSWLADDNDNETWAVFGNVAVDVVPEVLELSAAGRYDRELRTQFVSEDNTAGLPGAVNEATFEEMQPKFTLRFTPQLDSDVIDLLNLYGSWGKGFRSGQFNQNGVSEAAEDAGIEGVQDVVDEEEARTWEAGFKSIWGGGLLSLEGAFYRTEDEGMPFFLFIGGVGAQVLVNIDESELVGFDGLARLNLPGGFDAYAGLGIADTEIQAFALNPDNVGNKIPLVPETTVNLGAQYKGPVSESVDLFARADYERRGEQFWDPSNANPRDALNFVGFRAGGSYEDWNLTFEIDNAFDEVYNSEFVAGGFAHPARPEQWKVLLGRSF